MRSTITIVTVSVILGILSHSMARAQYYSYSNAIPAQVGGQPGYYVPVVAGDDGVTAAGYSMRVSDEDEPNVPMVSNDGGAGCACPSCDQRGCDGRCGEGWLSCRNDSLFSRSFGSVEYLNWWNKGINLPPLVTTSPPGTVQAAAGVLPGATVLFGGTAIDDDRQSGGRVTFGRWLDDCGNLALTGKFYGVESGAVGFTASSPGTPILGRPFFNLDPIVNAEDALLVAFPGLTSGTVSAIAENDMLGFEIYGRSLLDATDLYRVDLIGGYQFNRIDSDLAMTSSHTAGLTDFVFSDLFDVENEYHAGTAGIYTESYMGNWTLSALGKIGIGNMRQTVAISGTNSITAGGVTVASAGGLFAQPTNIGTFERDVLVWSPEANFKLSCAVTEHISLSVGYTFLYFTRAAFAGDQLDRNVNATQLSGGAIVGPANPAFAFHDTDFWVQTVDLGFSWNY